MATTPIVPGTVNAERAFVEEYERQRRLGLLLIMAPSFLVISALLIVAFTAFGLATPDARPFGAQIPSPLLLDGPLLGAVLIHATALLLARRGRVTIPTVLVLTGSILVILAIDVLWIQANGLDILAVVGVTTLGVVIVVAGALGDLRLIVGVTLAINAASLGLLLGALALNAVSPPLLDGINGQMLLFAPTILMTQWAVAATMIALWRNFQRTLRQVGVAYDRARQLDELKSQFISSVNHELRTPLATLQSYIQASVQGWERLSPAEVKAALEQADRVSRTLSDLVKSVLSTRRIEQEAGGFVPEPVLVRQAVETAITLLGPREGTTEPRDLHLRVPADLVAWGESTRLQQIITNLISNAIKYSPAGSPIEVRATLEGRAEPRAVAGRGRRGHLAERAAEVEIVVRDYGRGIPPDQAPLLFNRFVRLPRDLASTTGGTGLGLYLCRVYAEAMGGRVWVESSGVEGEGSAFHVRLPTPPIGKRAIVSLPLGPRAAAHP